MDFDLTETQEIVKRTAREFLTNECPKELVREMERNNEGYSPELWKKMAELGWMGLVFPETYAGGGGSFLDLVILLEEMGRALLPGPFFSTVILGGMTILEAGSERQKKEFLPLIASGKLIVTLALTESSAKFTADGIKTEAKEVGDGFIISGTKLFVPDAHISDYIIYAARTKKASSKSKEDGISLFFINSKSPGINITMLKTIGGDKQCEVTFNNVKCNLSDVLGKLNEGWLYINSMLQRAAIGKCAEMIGGAQQVLETTVNYAKERVQFEHPIGSYQFIQNQCVQMAINTVTSKFITYQAAWKMSEGLACSKDIAMAKSWVSDSYRQVVALGQQCNGANAYMLDHTLPLYFTRAKAAELAYGDADFHRELVAQEIGL